MKLSWGFMGGRDKRLSFSKVVVLVVLASYFVGTPVPASVACAAILASFGWKGVQLGVEALKSWKGVG